MANNKPKDLKMTNRADVFYLLRGFAMLLIFGIHSIIVLQKYMQTTGKVASIVLHTPAWAGCWILFVLSGYLLGKGFVSGKYSLDLDGVLKFYKRRIFSIVPLYWFALLIVFLFINPEFFINSNPWHLFSFTYDGSNPGCEEVGAFWFVSTIMQLYLITPFLYKYIVSRVKESNLLPLVLLVIALGLIFRLFGSYFLGWYKHVYTSFYGNLDLYISGLLFSRYLLNAQNTELKKYLRFMVVAVLLAFVVCNTYLYHKYGGFWAYQYIYPTIYLIMTLGIFYAFDYVGRPRSEELSLTAMINNPLRILEGFGVMSFGFYLFHSNILNIVGKALSSYFQPLYLILEESGGVSIVFILVALLCFLVSCVWATVVYFAIENPTRKIA